MSAGAHRKGTTDWLTSTSSRSARPCPLPSYFEYHRLMNWEKKITWHCESRTCVQYASHIDMFGRTVMFLGRHYRHGNHGTGRVSMCRGEPGWEREFLGWLLYRCIYGNRQEQQPIFFLPRVQYNDMWTYTITVLVWPCMWRQDCFCVLTDRLRCDELFRTQFCYHVDITKKVQDLGTNMGHVIIQYQARSAREEPRVEGKAISLTCIPKCLNPRIPWTSLLIL